MATKDFSDLMRLSVFERMKLIEDLWDSINADPEPLPLTEEQEREIELRIAEHERDPSTAVPLEEVRERLRARYG